MPDFVATADARGLAIDVSAAWSLPSTEPRILRVVRRRRGYPMSPDDGITVLDLADLFVARRAPWHHIDRTRFLLLNPRAEGGILQAELSEYFAAARDPHASRVAVRIYDAAKDKLQTTVIDAVTRVTGAVSSGSIAIFTGAGTLAGTLAVTGDSVSWKTPGAVITAPFVRQETQRTSSSVSSEGAPGAALHVSFITTLGDQILRTSNFTEQIDPDSGDVQRTLAVHDREPPRRSAQGLDRGLDPGVTYYYVAFPGPAMRPWSAAATATDRHGFAEKLYALLPGAHRTYDDPASGPAPGVTLPGSFQLRRFLEVLGPGLDQARSLTEGLRTLQDVFDTRADFLPYLARWIGWELDRTLSTERQRTDLLFAPEVFATVGSLPNIQALVHRSTGWSCQVKEFANNVFLTNAVEQIRLWEIWQVPDVAATFDPTPRPQPAPLRVTEAIGDSIDARPAIVTETAGNPTWLFWHARRPTSARRQIWMMPLDGPGAARPVMQGAPDDASGLTFSDEWPAAIADGPLVRLFWSSDRMGSAGIWTRTLENGIPGDASRLTNHPSGDHHPVVVKDAKGTIWLFWESRRRGPSDIWAMTLANGATSFSAPQRITGGDFHDRMPNAVLDSTGQIRLFWTRDLGDRTRIFQSIFDGATWKAPVDVSSASRMIWPSQSGSSPHFRDEAPAVVLFNKEVWLFFGSNRDGRWHIWASKETGSGFRPPVRVTGPGSDDMEPAAFANGSGALRLVFRTQRSGEAFRSRTVDFADLGAIQRGKVEDRWHYTYSVDRSDTSFYARDTVGLYITPDDNVNRGPYQDEADRVRTLVEPFRPLPVHFVWFVEPPNTVESLYGQVDIGEGYTDVYPIVDHLGDIGESTTVALPGVTILHANIPADVSANPADLTTLRRRTFFPDPE
jgi:phage tail-like protein